MKKAMPMSTASLPPLPATESKRLVQGEVSLELFMAVKRECDRRKPKVKIREVLEYGLGAYLLKVNPRVAAELGIYPEK